MEPIISPWLIYFASRADAVGTLFLIVAVAAFAICLIGFDDLTKNGFKLFISIGIISVILTVLTPTTETVYTMMVANELTSDNVQAIGKTGKDVKMIILIKAGCFNELDSPDRMETMKKFLSRNVFTPIDKLTMQQFNSALEYDIFPKEMETMIRIKNFKAYALHESFFLKNIIDEGKKVPKKGYHDRYFALDERGTEFLMEHFNTCIVGTKEDGVIISEKLFNKEWDALIQPLKDYMALPETLQLYNQKKLDSTMESYASGSLEQWDMESLSYYPDRHELWNLNEPKYGVVDYNSLPEIPEVYEHTTRRVRGEIKHFPKYKIFRLAGTVLDSDNNKHLVSLLTNHGVVTCKYNKGQYSYYNKRISEQTPAGKKKVLEESWFKRGSKIIVCGYRREDQFVIMKYPDTVYTHTTNRIEEIYNDGTILAQTDRKKVGEG